MGIFFKKVVDDPARFISALHAWADEDGVVLVDIVGDIFVGDHDPIPKLSLGPHSHELVVLHDGTGEVHHVHEAAGHTGTPKGSRVEQAGATDDQDPAIVTFFVMRGRELDLGEVGGEVWFLHKRLVG